MRRLTITALTAALILSACGSDDDSSDDVSSSATEVAATDPPATDPAPTDPPATDPPATDPPVTDPPATDPPVTEPSATDAPADGPVADVTLVEWEIVAPTEYAAGPVQFDATNNGEFPHELVMIRGESYDSLPQLANGAVDEEALAPGDLIGRIERFESGQTGSATWELEAGNYVLLCNIAVGPNSHAAAGQVLSVTVT